MIRASTHWLRRQGTTASLPRRAASPPRWRRLAFAPLCALLACEASVEDSALRQEAERVLAENPNSARGHNMLGISYAQDGDARRAIESFNLSIHIDPDYGRAYSNRALARLDIGQRFRALEDANDAVRLDPENTHIRYMRGVTRMRMQYWPEAIADFSDIIARDPGHVFALRQRGEAKRRLACQAEALADWNQALAVALEQGNEDEAGLLRARIADAGVDAVAVAPDAPAPAVHPACRMPAPLIFDDLADAGAAGDSDAAGTAGDSGDSADALLESAAEAPAPAPDDAADGAAERAE